MQQRDEIVNPLQVCPVLLWFAWCLQGVTSEGGHEVGTSVLKVVFG